MTLHCYVCVAKVLTLQCYVYVAKVQDVKRKNQEQWSEEGMVATLTYVKEDNGLKEASHL